MAISTTLSRPTTRDLSIPAGFAGILTSSTLAFGMMAQAGGHTQLANVLMLAFLVGWGACLISLRKMGAFGESPIALAWAGLQIMTLTLATVWQAAQAIQPGMGSGTVFFAIGDACWPISVTGMMITGLALLSAGKTTGWLRFAPLTCGFSYPIGMWLAGMFGPDWHIAFGVLAAYGWSAFGLLTIMTARQMPQEPNVG